MVDTVLRCRRPDRANYRKHRLVKRHGLAIYRLVRALGIVGAPDARSQQKFYTHRSTLIPQETQEFRHLFFHVDYKKEV